MFITIYIHDGYIRQKHLPSTDDEHKMCQNEKKFVLKMQS